MRRTPLAVGLALAVALVAGPAVAQQPATAVQLPTFSMFTASTTVSVPDRGNVLLGGINLVTSPLLTWLPATDGGKLWMP